MVFRGGWRPTCPDPLRVERPSVCMVPVPLEARRLAVRVEAIGDLGDEVERLLAEYVETRPGVGRVGARRLQIDVRAALHRFVLDSLAER